MAAEQSPQTKQARGATWRRVVAVAIAVVGAVILVMFGLIRRGTPSRPLSGPAGEFETLTVLMEQVTEPAERARLEVERLRLLDERAQQASDRGIRLGTALVQAAGLVGIAWGAVIAWQQLQHNREQLHETLKAGQHERELNRSAQLAERFTRAVDQLGKAGAEHVDVRLGGVYALEQIAKDDLAEGEPVYRNIVTEVLTAFVRGHAPWPPSPDSAYGSHIPTDALMDDLPELQVRAADVQAAMTVLNRPPEGRQPGLGHLDLHGVDLRRAFLGNAHLEYAYFARAHLECSDLGFAHMEGSILREAHLNGTVLIGTHLEGADLVGAHLGGAYADRRTG